MIIDFLDKEAAQLFKDRIPSRAFPLDIHRITLRKLLMLDAATILDDLKIPPGNHLEKLSGDREGQYSIRINKQWRVCFQWQQGNAYRIEIVDYH